MDQPRTWNGGGILSEGESIHGLPLLFKCLFRMIVRTCRPRPPIIICSAMYDVKGKVAIFVTHFWGEFPLASRRRSVFDILGLDCCVSAGCCFSLGASYNVLCGIFFSHLTLLFSAISGVLPSEFVEKTDQARQENIFPSVSGPKLVWKNMAKRHPNMPSRNRDLGTQIHSRKLLLKMVAETLS